jgi:metallo-beta-lactamase class B
MGLQGLEDPVRVVSVVIACLAVAGCSSSGGSALVPDAPMACSMCDEWNAPATPFTVFGNTHFVGTRGLSSLLIDTGEGLVLIDVALPQSAPLIDASIRTLGFATRDVKYILTSHAHYDHVGGVRSMQRFTGATVLASASTAQALALGHPVPEDPQFGTGPSDAFPAVSDGVRVVRDGETIRIGGTTITAHDTPGHTPGATTWTWQSCEGARCLNVVYVDSLTAVSKDGYRYSAIAGLVDTFRATLGRVSTLPCDVLISTHPSATGMDDKLAARVSGRLAPGDSGDPFVDPTACAALADRSMRALDERLAIETRTPGPEHRAREP